MNAMVFMISVNGVGGRVIVVVVVYFLAKLIEAVDLMKDVDLDGI